MPTLSTALFLEATIEKPFLKTLLIMSYSLKHLKKRAIITVFLSTHSA